MSAAGKSCTVLKRSNLAPNTWGQLPAALNYRFHRQYQPAVPFA